MYSYSNTIRKLVFQVGPSGEGCLLRCTLNNSIRDLWINETISGSFQTRERYVRNMTHKCPMMQWIHVTMSSERLRALPRCCISSLIYQKTVIRSLLPSNIARARDNWRNNVLRKVTRIALTFNSSLIYRTESDSIAAQCYHLSLPVWDDKWRNNVLQKVTRIALMFTSSFIYQKKSDSISAQRYPLGLPAREISGETMCSKRLHALPWYLTRR